MKEGMMKSLLKKTLLIALVSTLYVTMQAAMATTGQTSQVQQENRIKELQDYLNGIRTLRANFSQNNQDGTASSGKIYMKRFGNASFGKLRLDYTPPTQIKIIANGEVLRYEDGEKKDISEYSIDRTPVSFLLRHKIDFSDGLEVKNMKTEGEKIYLTIIRPGDDDVTLTLIFDTSPMLRLQGWSVVDAQANKTHVVLSQVEIGIPLEENLFTF